jgi:integrase
VICCYYAFIVSKGLKFSSVSAARTSISDYYLLSGRLSPCNDPIALFRFKRTRAWCAVMRPVCRARAIPSHIVASVARASLLPPRPFVLWYFAFALLAVCAVRTSTLLALLPSDFSFNASGVTIVWRKVKKRFRAVSCFYVSSPSCWPGWSSVLKCALAGKPHSRLIFEDLSAEVLGDAVRELCLRAGMDVSAREGLTRVTPRSLRRTAAQRAFEEGASEDDIALLLMHRSTLAQEPYLHDDPGKIWRVASLSKVWRIFSTCKQDQIASAFFT